MIAMSVILFDDLRGPLQHSYEQIRPFGKSIESRELLLRVS